MARSRIFLIDGGHEALKAFQRQVGVSGEILHQARDQQVALFLVDRAGRNTVSQQAPRVRIVGIALDRLAYQRHRGCRIRIDQLHRRARQRRAIAVLEVRQRNAVVEHRDFAIKDHRARLWIEDVTGVIIVALITPGEFQLSPSAGIDQKARPRVQTRRAVATLARDFHRRNSKGLGHARGVVRLVDADTAERAEIFQHIII